MAAVSAAVSFLFFRRAYYLSALLPAAAAVLAALHWFGRLRADGLARRRPGSAPDGERPSNHGRRGSSLLIAAGILAALSVVLYHACGIGASY